MLLIELLLSVGKHSLCTLILLNLNFGGRKLLGAVTIHSLHLCLTSLSLGLLLSFLLLMDFLRGGRIDLACDHSLLPHALNLGLSDNGSLTSGTLTSLLNVATHLTQIVIAHDSAISV